MWIPSSVKKIFCWQVSLVLFLVVKHWGKREILYSLVFLHRLVGETKTQTHRLGPNPRLDICPNAVSLNCQSQTQVYQLFGQGQGRAEEENYQEWGPPHCQRISHVSSCLFHSDLCCMKQMYEKLEQSEGSFWWHATQWADFTCEQVTATLMSLKLFCAFSW